MKEGDKARLRGKLRSAYWEYLNRLRGRPKGFIRPREHGRLGSRNGLGNFLFLLGN